MDIKNLISTEYKVFNPDDRVSKLGGFFEETNNKAVIVQGKDDDGKIEGIVTQRQLLSSHVKPGEKLKSILVHPPRIDPNEDVRETSRLMVESNLKVLPVFEDDSLVGVVTADNILSEVLPHLKALTVEDVYTEGLISVNTDDKMGRVINLMRENGISRLVVKEDGRIEGIVSLYDLLGFSIRALDREKKSGMEEPVKQGGKGEQERMLDIPVRDFMSSPAEAIASNKTLDKAVKKMLDMDYSSLVVTDSDNMGIITKTDVLRSLTWEQEEGLDVQITNVELLDTNRDWVTELIEKIDKKYSDMKILHAHVRLQKHKENQRGQPLILARILLHTDQGKFPATGEGYGAKQALRIARDRLERKVLSEKEEKTSYDAERLFKELGLSK